ncbi:MAG TPA: UDP-glucose 4-epimerase GalE [Chitinophagaceae bacterium]|nr:UDP-glucose 4-epimerase GalE [Chitinophagaceae bacterium]HNU14438.1 UDP-glucose 4-epimerase GalE [Chitinophagaceae bacterium]
MSRQKILVTGGLGFIGSHTVAELQQAGYDVVILDDLSNSSLQVLDRIEKITAAKPMFYQINMLGKNRLKEMFSAESDIAAVIHFVAFKAVGESVKEPLKYFHNNLLSLIHLLECMEEYGIENIVFSSSATVYGDPVELPVTESTPFKKALSSYGSTKQMGEEILEKTSAAKNIKAIALRYFNPVGAHASSLIGELPLGIPNNLMPFITQTAAGLRGLLTVFGNDYDTPDGTCLRDYIHVVDLAKAHVKSCDRLLQAGMTEKYEVYNIGTGNAISVMEMIKAFEEHNQVKLNYKIGERRAGDATAVYADVKKAAQVLGWKAELGLQEMVTSAWNWQTNLMEMTTVL